MRNQRGFDGARRDWSAYSGRDIQHPASRTGKVFQYPTPIGISCRPFSGGHSADLGVTVFIASCNLQFYSEPLQLIGKLRKIGVVLQVPPRFD